MAWVELYMAVNFVKGANPTTQCSCMKTDIGGDGVGVGVNKTCANCPRNH